MGSQYGLAGAGQAVGVHWSQPEGRDGADALGGWGREGNWILDEPLQSSRGLGSDLVETHKFNREGSRREALPLVDDIFALAATVDKKLLGLTRAMVDGDDVLLGGTAGTAAQEGEEGLKLVRLSRHAVSLEVRHILSQEKELRLPKQSEYHMNIAPKGIKEQRDFCNHSNQLPIYINSN